MSKITSIFESALETARATGRDQRRDLRNGARLSVRVREGEVTLTISRPKKLVGDRELITFKVDCGVPEHAQRKPEQGQRLLEQDGGWWCVTFSWPLVSPARRRIADQVAALNELGYHELAHEVAFKSRVFGDESEGLQRMAVYVDGMIERLRAPFEDDEAPLDEDELLNEIDIALAITPVQPPNPLHDDGCEHIVEDARRAVEEGGYGEGQTALFPVEELPPLPRGYGL